jgi:anti-anti-sigma regulatory factor
VDSPWRDDGARFEVDLISDVARGRTVRVCGEVDIATSALLRDALMAAADGSGDITVDLAEVTFADTHLGHDLIELRVRQDGYGHRLNVINIPRRVRRLLVLANFDQDLGVCHDEEPIGANPAG